MKIWTKSFCYAAAAVLLAGCAKKELQVTENDAAANAQPKLKTEAVGTHVVKTNLFDYSNTTVSGMSNYHSYFSPSIVYCTNTSTIVAFAEGRLGGPNDGVPSNIMCQRSFDNGVTWVTFQKAVGNATDSYINPTTVYDPNHGGTEGRIWLFVNVVTTAGAKRVDAFYNDHSGSGTFIQVPSGTMYTAGNSLVGVGPGSGIISRANSNLIVIPAENRNIISTDGGVNWTQSSTAWTHRSTEATIFEAEDGKFHRNDRASSVTGSFPGLWTDVTSTHRRNISTSSSTNPAGAWSDLAIEANLPDPKCHATLTHYSTGNLVFCNSADVASRYYMKVRLSTNDGSTWSAGRYLYTAGAAGKGGYSCITRVGDYSMGLLCNTASDPDHMTATTNHFKIDFHRIDLNWVNGL